MENGCQKKRKHRFLILIAITGCLLLVAGLDYYQNTLSLYYNYNEVVQQLRELERKYPDWAKLYDLNDYLQLANTHENRQIYALQVSAHPQLLEDEGKIMLTGLHHSNEITTHHAVIDAAKDFLQKANNKDPRYLKWLQTSAIWFVPVINPDGLEYVLAGHRDWRNNRSPYNRGKGVDLNRNYSFKWSMINAADCGPHALSEPEVQVMDRLNSLLRCQYLVSYHSFGREVLYPYRSGKMAETEVYYQVRDQLRQKLGYSMRPPRATGEDIEHHYHRYGTISFILEIGMPHHQPPFFSYYYQVRPEGKKVVPFLLEQLHEPHVYINVRDGKTKKPLVVSLELQELKFSEGETRTTDQFGSYRWRLPAGKYQLRVAKAGYFSKTIGIIASNSKNHRYLLTMTLNKSSPQDTLK